MSIIKEHSEFMDDIVKYLAGEMTSAEKEIFQERLNSDPELKILYDQYLQIWNGAESISDRERYDIDSEWSMIEKKIDFGKPKRNLITLYPLYSRIAAILIIGLVGIAALFVTRNLLQYEKVSVTDSMEKIELNDGSEVTLNHDSKIRYVVGENSNQRRVVLQGEAYFEVARDTSRPFVIDAGEALVKVLGTSFNVDAYKDKSTIEVSVHSGVVSVEIKGKESEPYIIRKGNKGIYNKSLQTFEVMEMSDGNDYAWKTMELTFNQATFSEVISVINQAYHANITIENPELAACPITVKFYNQDLSSVLEVLINTLDITMSRSDGKLILSGKGCN